ncbi:MAG: hypothetical protein U0271_44995 [Polyangiaceae bacterium]
MVRSAQAQSLLSVVERLPEFDRIARQAGDDVLERIRTTTALGWLPLQDHMAVADAVRDVLGVARSIEAWRAAMLHAFKLPYLKSFVQMSTSLFGVSPASLLKRADTVYAYVVRDAGSLEFSALPGAKCELVVRDFPAARHRFVCWLEGLEGCLLGTLDLGRFVGEARIAEIDDQRGFARYEVSWRL